jgi:hypothetical protein
MQNKTVKLSETKALSITFGEFKGVNNFRISVMWKREDEPDEEVYWKHSNNGLTISSKDVAKVFLQLMEEKSEEMVSHVK